MLGGSSQPPSSLEWGGWRKEDGVKVRTSGAEECYDRATAPSNERARLRERAVGPLGREGG